MYTVQTIEGYSHGRGAYWVGLVFYDDKIVHKTEPHSIRSDAAQAAFQWIKEWMHSRVCDRNAVELP